MKALPPHIPKNDPKVVALAKEMSKSLSRSHVLEIHKALYLLTVK